MKTRITTYLVGILLTLCFFGEALAQVPSSVTQQLRLSTGGGSPNYVQHRAIVAGQDGHTSTSGAAPAVNGWYAWDQVPTTVPGTNYLLFLNDLNEVRRTSSFSVTEKNFLARVNTAGNNLEFIDPDGLVVAQNGLNETQGANTIELGGTLLRGTTIDQATFGMTFLNNGATASNFILGGGTGDLNTSINPGTGGNVTMSNIDADNTTTSILSLDATGNVRTHALSSLVGANNGLVVDYTTTPGTATVQLGSAGPTGSGAPLLTNRFVDMAGLALNFEGSGNVNLGNGGTNNLSVNINTGSTGNFTLQGGTLSPASPVPANFLYVDATNNVRSADVSSIPTGTASTFLAVDATGNVVNAPNPLSGVFRGQIAGTGTYIYNVTGLTTLAAGASIICTVENHISPSPGTIGVQVTTVTAGTGFSVETTENIPNGSFINYIVMNP